ncbi:MAG: flagellar assembly protein FliW [Rickettsiales bacterium]
MKTIRDAKGEAITFRDCASPALQGERMVHNRFGVLNIFPERAVYVKGGLIGFPQEREYCLTDYPGRDEFKLLQSITDDDLCFIVLPAAPEGGYYYPEHAEELCALVDAAPDAAVFLFVVSVAQKAGKRVVTFNGKAPVVVNVDKKYAVQRALSYRCYNVRQEVKAEKKAYIKEA